MSAYGFRKGCFGGTRFIIFSKAPVKRTISWQIKSSTFDQSQSENELRHLRGVHLSFTAYDFMSHRPMAWYPAKSSVRLQLAKSPLKDLQLRRQTFISRAIPHAGSDDLTGIIPVAIFHPVFSNPFAG